MTKQEEIKKGLVSLLFGVCMHITDNPDDKAEEIMGYLHSQGVVIKVEDWLPTRDGMTCTIEPLIEVAE